MRLTGSNTRPGCTPVNASIRRLLNAPHHSRPRRLVRSCLVRLFHSQLSSGLRRRTLSRLSGSGWLTRSRGVAEGKGGRANDGRWGSSSSRGSEWSQSILSRSSSSRSSIKPPYQPFQFIIYRRLAPPLSATPREPRPSEFPAPRTYRGQFGFPRGASALFVAVERGVE